MTHGIKKKEVKNEVRVEMEMVPADPKTGVSTALRHFIYKLWITSDGYRNMRAAHVMKINHIATFRIHIVDETR